MDPVDFGGSIGGTYKLFDGEFDSVFIQLLSNNTYIKQRGKVGGTSHLTDSEHLVDISLPAIGRNKEYGDREREAPPQTEQKQRPVAKWVDVWSSCHEYKYGERVSFSHGTPAESISTLNDGCAFLSALQYSLQTVGCRYRCAPSADTLRENFLYPICGEAGVALVKPNIKGQNQPRGHPALEKYESKELDRQA